MKTISQMPVSALGIVSSWLIFLFWISVWILIAGFREERRIKSAAGKILTVFLLQLSYSLFQFTVICASENAETPKMIQLAESYSHLPFLLIVGICVILTVLEINMVIYIRHWDNTHITSASIKEMVETLPVGVCAYEAGGKITLKNRTMEQLCRSLTGTALLNGNEFAQMLADKKSDLTNFSVELPDYSVWSFTREEISDKRNSFILLIAYNVTEEYLKTQMLSEKQKILQEHNQKLLEYNKCIESVIAEHEILNAKVRIHDELGAGLLAIRRYLAAGGTENERAELLNHLSANISFLLEEAASDTQDEYALMITTAEKLGVTVIINGILPEAEPVKHILATAIHECFTNIIRHTDGDTLFINITENEHSVTAEFTDNNTKPVSSISETGGLRSLRDLTEKMNGKMSINAVPRFCLTVILKKETDKYGL